jgi:hypothetical protein
MECLIFKIPTSDTIYTSITNTLKLLSESTVDIIDQTKPNHPLQGAPSEEIAEEEKKVEEEQAEVEDDGALAAEKQAEASGPVVGKYYVSRGLRHRKILCRECRIPIRTKHNFHRI